MISHKRLLDSLDKYKISQSQYVPIRALTVGYNVPSKPNSYARGVKVRVALLARENFLIVADGFTGKKEKLKERIVGPTVIVGNLFRRANGNGWYVIDIEPLPKLNLKNKMGRPYVELIEEEYEIKWGILDYI